MQTIRHLAILAITSIFISFVIWLPHLLSLPNFFNLDFSQGFNTIYRNFDGLEYVISAKTLYEPGKLAQLPQSLEAIYYASRFPIYPLILIPVALLLGFLKSMLLVTMLFTILSAWAFYFLVRDFKLTSQPLWLSIVFLVLPARWVIVHSIGSSEPVFIFLIITAIYLFLKFEAQKNWHYIWAAALFGSLAQLTRPPGGILFVALGLYVLWTHRRNLTKILNYYPLLLIPVSLLGLFYYYSQVFGDFLAYFHSGDNIHLALPPFQIFNKEQFWVGDIWLEDIIYIFILGFLGGLTLIKQKLNLLGIFVLTYLGISTLIAHRDISRYTLPAMPFVIIAFEKVLVTKEFKIVMIILALAIYLYSQNFILANTAPYPNLSVFD